MPEKNACFKALAGANLQFCRKPQRLAKDHATVPDLRIWCLKRLSLELRKKPHCTVAVSSLGGASVVEPLA